ncbi:MAG: HEAT repeat domain-containing protein [Candidatus Rifleibacteriota bacterium]
MDAKVKRLLKDLSNPDDDLRALSTMTLMKLDFADRETREEVLEELVKVTGDKNVSVRFFARKAIDKIRKAEKLLKISMGNEGHPPLDEMLQAEDFEDRLQAVMQIKNEKKAEYAEKMIEMLKVEQHAFVRAGLISALKFFLKKEQVEILSSFIDDPDNRVRSNTIEALEYLKVEAAIPSLFSALNDPDNRIRAGAAKALQSFGEEKVFAELKKMLESTEEWMKGSAIYALSHIQAGEAIRLLIETARVAEHGETRIKAIIALANYHDLSSYSFLKGLAANGEGAFKEAANRAIKLHEEKFGINPPEISLLDRPGEAEKAAENVSAAEGSSPESNDIATAVTKFFRKGKDEAVGLSNKAAISFNVTDLKKELEELYKEIGKVAFDYYQAAQLEIPELLTIGHEVLRMNFFIQKYTEQKEQEAAKKPVGFFEQLKGLFSKSPEQAKAESQTEKFSKKRDELFAKMGKMTIKHYESGEFQPKTLEGYYLTYQKLQHRLGGEPKKAN